MRTVHMVQIGLYHLLFGLAVVAIDGFLPARLSVLGISSLWTGIVVGTYSFSEAARIPFALISDSRSLFSRRRTSYIVVGNLVATLSFLTIPMVITSPIILISVVGFALGLSLSGPAADALLIDLSSEEERATAASTLHTLRILGFAMGGMMGTLIHRKWGFSNLFYVFGVVMLILTILSVYRVPDSGVGDNKPNNLNKPVNEIFTDFKNNLNKKNVILLTLFLLVFQIGLFMQNPILERFGIEEIMMPEEQAGTLNTAWAVGTLIAVLFASIYLMKRIGRMMTAYIGLLIAVLGLFLISIVTTLSQLYVSTFIFGIGSGLGSIPAIAIMMDICEGRTAASMIAFFGLIDALGKGTAAIMAGGLGQALGYRPIFQIEMFILLLAIILLRLTWIAHTQITDAKDKTISEIRTETNLI